MSLLELRDVCFSYKNRSGVGVSNISFAVDPGETVAIIGKSGVGKSTLLKLIANQISPQTGQIVRSERMQSFGAISYLDQEATLFPWKQLGQSFQLAIDQNQSSRLAERELPLRDALQAFGLENAEKLYPAQLSGGMKQRAALAFAILKGPALLLLDEPFSALDDQTRQGLYDLLETKILETQSGVVLVSHNIDESLILANRIILLAGSPARLVDEFLISAPQPRTAEYLFSEEFLRLKRRILQAILQ